MLLPHLQAPASGRGEGRGVSLLARLPLRRSASLTASRLDKNVFQEGLSSLQSKLEDRFYTTTLTFAHDLCEVIYAGINIEAKLSTTPSQTRSEAVDASPSKQSTYAEARDRKRLGKRILKAVQPQLEAALRAEADVSHKPIDSLRKELEGMLERSVEMRQPSIVVSRTGGPAPGSAEDAVMADVEGQIIVAGDEDVVAADEEEGAAGDRMDVDEPAADAEVAVEVTRPSLAKSVKVNGIMSSNASVADVDKDEGADAAPPTGGPKATDTPPNDGDYAPVAPPDATDPLTPPQSNGSLGRHEAADVLNDGGVPWYMKGFRVEGTTAAEEQWAGRDAVRSLSEDLTDMDDEELNGLEFVVDDPTITASPAADDGDAGVGAGAGKQTLTVPSPAGGRRRADPAKFRKGVRSSTRRR